MTDFDPWEARARARRARRAELEEIRRELVEAEDQANNNAADAIAAENALAEMTIKLNEAQMELAIMNSKLAVLGRVMDVNGIIKRIMSDDGSFT